MMPNAAALSADDMADLGAYFDSLTNTGLEADPSYWQAGREAISGRRRGARDSGMHGLSRPDRHAATNPRSFRRCAASNRCIS